MVNAQSDDMSSMVFGDFDADASGGISEDEFNAMSPTMMSMMGGEMTMGFSDLDTNADGMLDETEFDAMNASMMGMMDTMMVEDGTYEVPLSGSQEVPPVMTDATGSATFTLMGDSLSVTGDFEGLSSMAVEVAGSPAHIHMAPMGENGDVIIPLNVTLGEDGMSGIFSTDATLTPEQTDAIMAGNLYINVHSEMHQGGELRGQLVPGMMGMSGDMMGETGGAMMGMAFADLDTDGNGTLSEDELNAGMEMSGGTMMGAFGDYDTDASGDVSEDEFNAMSGMMGEGDAMMDGMTGMTFTDLDTNGDGNIDQMEFDTAMGMMDGMTGMTFADADTNGDGNIDQMEFDTMSSMMMNDSSAAGDALTVVGPDGAPLMVFADLDADGNGTIDENEFNAAMEMSGSTMTGTFSDFDTDGDGTLNEDEYNAMSQP